MFGPGAHSGKVKSQYVIYTMNQINELEGQYEINTFIPAISLVK